MKTLISLSKRVSLLNNSRSFLLIAYFVCFRAGFLYRLVFFFQGNTFCKVLILPVPGRGEAPPRKIERGCAARFPKPLPYLLPDQKLETLFMA